MKWSDVGQWLQQHAGTGAALVGSLLTGNVPGAVAAGVALVSSATGHAAPDQALQALQQDPATVIRLRELAIQEQDSIREHIRAIAELEAKDRQAEHEQTQQTIRSGDNAEDVVVRRTRPLQSWASLLAAFGYVAWREGSGAEISVEVLMILLTLPWAYAGLRQIGKGVDTWGAARAGKVK
jgi:hypothetical protein